MASQDRRRKHERAQNARRAELETIPVVADPKRRWLCGESLSLFLTTYFPESTGLTVLSNDHMQMIDRLQHIIETNGRLLNWVYRGFAKTTTTELASFWAIAYGKRKFAALFSFNNKEAAGLIDSIIREIETNDLLAEDFPEICIPFRALNGKSQLASSQTYDGELTKLVMKKDTLVFPTVRNNKGEYGNAEYTPSSGAIIRAKGLLAGTRGMKYKRADGTQQRPDLYLIDDPQDDTSARSDNQVTRRLNVLRKGILMSTGHRRKAACVVNATCIEPNDFVEQLANPDLHKGWQVLKVPMVKTFPDEHEGLWEQYGDIITNFDNAIIGDFERAQQAALEFYEDNRADMDRGADVSWHNCYAPDDYEISALQHAYNFYFIEGADVFSSECQGEPVSACPSAVPSITPMHIRTNLHGVQRSMVPTVAELLTGFVDIHEDVLYWAVCAWEPNFTGYVVDYGTWPDQRRSYFTKRQASKTLKTHYRTQNQETAVEKGLTEISDRLCERTWRAESGEGRKLKRMFFDCGYSQMFQPTELVVKKSPYKEILDLSRGDPRDVGKRFSEYGYRPGWKLGKEYEWASEKPEPGRPRIYRFDTNWWKLFLRCRLVLTAGTPGSLSLFGTRQQVDHRLMADHLLSEFPKEKEAFGRTMIVWELTPGRDNHWLDCLIGCALAAAEQGCDINLGKIEKPKKTRRERWKELAQRRHQAD